MRGAMMINGQFKEVAASDIENHLTTVVEADADLETRVKALVVKWDALDTNVAIVKGGGVGDVFGLSYDPQTERKVIKEKMQVPVPYFRQHEYLMKGRISGHPEREINVPIQGGF